MPDDGGKMTIEKAVDCNGLYGKVLTKRELVAK
jgi:hypothetical protein